MKAVVHMLSASELYSGPKVISKISVNPSGQFSVRASPRAGTSILTRAP